MPPCSQEIKTPKGVNIKVTAKPVITLDELKTHNTKNSLWISIDDKVYDLTKWAAHHPGLFTLNSPFSLAAHFDHASSHIPIPIPSSFLDPVLFGLQPAPHCTVVSTDVSLL